MRKIEAIITMSVLVFPAVAAAQPPRGSGGGGMGLGAPTPVAADVSKIPVGAWAEYTMVRGESPPRKVRFAVVKRDKDGTTIEQTTEMGGEQGGTFVMSVVVGSDPTKEGGVKKAIIQRGDNDPMEVPVGGGPPPGGPGAGPAGGPGGGGRAFGPRFAKPDPKHLLGKESLKIAGGTFKTDHYQEEGRFGGTVHYWVNRDVPPYGLVKMETTPGSAPPDGERGFRGPRGPMQLALVGTGKGAKPTITKPAKPFDPESFRGPGRPGGPRPGASPAANP